MARYWEMIASRSDSYVGIERISEGTILVCIKNKIAGFTPADARRLAKLLLKAAEKPKRKKAGKK